ncbi:sugar ABC transporter permease YjfF [Nocardioides sp. GY 10113]|uniref:galactofuranose ABC transporter, permease protein YjfF n=1 Tax=Nocardioides sp. GY 10113 TaxID=2569761 RepID=UPI0010A7DAAB|nr:galactofuranose ABC transporter, permease protein YjfF [Nocardioides sp. GY 10113]TIC79762.1 sugar ABC transporter permease YjfF [Nocardioides sp. GY 10113]TIC84910.1 sugar ABC transporter permease YjfF [Nocardioides sp. GY 10113]
MSTATVPADSLWDRVRGYTPPSRYYPVLATLALFLGLFAVGGVRYEGFADPQVLLSLLIDNAFLIVLAVGMTFVILTGGIDLSVGSVVALSTMIAAKTLEMGWSPYLSIGAVLSTGILFGLLMGLLIHYFDIQPFIATLAGLFLARGLTFLISVESISIKDATFTEFAFKTVRVGDYYLRWTAIVALVVVAIGIYVLARTRFGRTVYAIGGSESSAMLMGLRVGFTKVGVYVISGFCAALGGLLFSFYILSGNSLHAVGTELDAIAAVVIGGTLLTGGRGYVVGSLLGVLVLGLIRVLISFDGTLSSYWVRIITGVLLLAFVLVQRFATRRQR